MTIEGKVTKVSLTRPDGTVLYERVVGRVPGGETIGSFGIGEDGALTMYIEGTPLPVIGDVNIKGEQQ